MALDLIGERWTWLIIRGLLTGPKRFGELLDQLPGIGTNLLSDRMKTLLENGIVEKRGKGRQSAYGLTTLGEELRPITHQLIRWGRHFATTHEKTQAADGGVPLSMPEWDMLALEAAFIPERADGVQAVMQLTLSGFTFHLVIRNTSCRAVYGPAVEPDVLVTTDSATLIAIGGNETSVESAEEKVKLKIEGDRSVFNQLFQLFE
ncbi:winged helix-turn-helix transcriptional regulator [Pseudomonadota bacterium]